MNGNTSRHGNVRRRATFVPAASDAPHSITSVPVDLDLLARIIADRQVRQTGGGES